jgi:hypothetical protein
MSSAPPSLVSQSSACEHALNCISSMEAHEYAPSETRPLSAVQMSSEIYKQRVEEYLIEYRKFMAQFDSIQFEKDMQDGFDKSQNNDLLNKLNAELSYYSENVAKIPDTPKVDDRIIEKRCDDFLIKLENKKLKKENRKLRRERKKINKVLDNIEDMKREMVLLKTQNIELMKENLAIRKQYDEEITHNDDLVDHIARFESDFIAGCF